MNVRTILKTLGLSEKEATVYMACLEYGPETITNVARRTGYKRPTVYNLMEGLLRSGFIVLLRRHRRTLYYPERPRKLLTVLRARERELERLLPELEVLRKAKIKMPSVEVFESEEAIKTLYDEIHDSFTTRSETYFVRSIADFTAHIPDAYHAYLSKITGKTYSIRELIFDDDEGRRHIQLLQQRKVRHGIRLLPNKFPLYNDLVIYGNTVVMFSYKDGILAARFDNREIATTQKTLFEWTWQNGRSNAVTVPLISPKSESLALNHPE